MEAMMAMVEGEVVAIITREDHRLAGEEAHHHGDLQDVHRDVLQDVTITKDEVAIVERNNLATDLNATTIVLTKNLTFLIQIHRALDRSKNLSLGKNIKIKRVALDLGHLQYHSYGHQGQKEANHHRNHSNLRSP